MKINLCVPVFFVLLIASAGELEADGVPAEKSFLAPHGMKISVKMAAPYAQTTDLQIICVFEGQGLR